MGLSIRNKNSNGSLLSSNSNNASSSSSSLTNSGWEGSYAPTLNTTNKLVEIVVDNKYDASPLELYRLMFDSDFFVEFLEDKQGVKGLEFEEWQERKEDNHLLMRDFHYSRANSGVGPKEIYCESHEENQHRDENDFIETNTTTNTPNVTYGKSFHVVTHTKISWSDSDLKQGCILNVASEVVWTGWCPFKGMIEGRVIDGQKQYFTDMNEAVQRELASLKAAAARPPRPSRQRTVSAVQYATSARRLSTSSSTSASFKPPRFVRFLSGAGSSSDEDNEEAVILEDSAEDENGASWVEKQQARPRSQVRPLRPANRQQRARLAVLVVLVSLALSLIILRLSA